VNVLVWSGFATVAELRDVGVRRISVGGALARTAWSGFFDAAREIAESGTFSKLDTVITGTDLNRLFAS
jgi:2-methylisocitrate lyase-like PEP mutase family enzyme